MHKTESSSHVIAGRQHSLTHHPSLQLVYLSGPSSISASWSWEEADMDAPSMPKHPTIPRYQNSRQLGVSFKPVTAEEIPDMG